MADIPLRTYVQQLDNLIERKNVDEAIAHARHILSFYPKHLDTYRMLGKALLEKGRHGDAADVFQRVLSVLPDDFISHVGMAIVREDEANLEAALWHMERAYEAMPSNGAIQQELCRLYGRRDGVVPPKARLTRGALGRMYMQGGLYMQAEAELKAALADDPERIDLQTILAQVYWYSEQPAAAAQLCGTIVQSLPYSQVGNRILREIFRSRGRDADAALYRQRLEALDPYEALAPAAGDGAGLSTAEQVEAGKVLVTRLEYVAGMEGATGPDWIASIGARFEEPLARSESTPDWLNAVDEPAALVEAADLPGMTEVPDWLASNAPAGAEPAPAEATSDLPTWLSELSQAGAASAAAPVADSDLPDWLKGAATGPLADEEVPAWMQTVGGAAETTPAAPFDETMPTWLAAAQAQGAQPGEAAAADWMDTLVPTPPAEASAPALAAAIEPGGESDLPDWIKSAAPASGAGDEDLPDWLKASTSTLTDPTASDSEAAAPWLAGAAAETPTTTADDQVPAWMSEAPSPTAAVETPEWMQTETPATPEAPQTVFETAQPAASLAPAEDVPDWLAGAAASVPGEDLPPWLREAAPPAAEIPAASEPPTVAFEAAETSASAAPGEDVPDWMSAEAAPAAVDAVPDWMQSPAAEPAPAQDEAPVAAATPADLPDWLQSIAPEAPAGETPAWTPSAAVDETVEPAGQAEPSAEATTADELPGWLQAAAAASPSDEVPAWLQTPALDEALAEASTPAAEAEPPAAVATPMEDMPAWLREAQAAPSDEAPAWMQSVAETPAPGEAKPPSLTTEPPAAEAASTNDLPDWLAAAAAASLAEEVPAWLQPNAEEPAAPAEAEPAPLTLEAETASSEAVMPGGAAEEAVPTAEADLPDWLRALSEDTEDKRTTHWEAMADAEFGVEEPGDLEEDEIEETEQPLPEGIPDWLQAVAATAPSPDSEPVQPELEADAPAPTAAPAVELPDFLQLASPEAIARSAVPFDLSDEPELTEAVAAEGGEDEPALVPGDMPDWLKALAPESPAAGASVTTFDADIMAAAAAGLNLDEAPDWLKSAQPAEAGLPTGTADLGLGDVPDWLQAAQPATPAAGAVDLNLDDAPDWLQEAAALSPAATAGEGSEPGEAETPAWLQGAVAEQPADLPPWAQVEAPGPTDTVINFLAAKETPDWLKQLREQAEQPLAEAEAAAPPAAETSLPAVEAEATPEIEAAVPLETTPEPVMEAAAPPALEEAAVPLEPSLDDMSPEETMRWLEGLAAQQGASADELFMSAPSEATAPPAAAASGAPVDEPVEEAGLPAALAGLDDWLREAEAGFEVDALADTAPHAKAQPAALPEWLTAGITDDIEAEAQAEPEAEAEAPAMTPPAWLSEIEALGEPAAATPAGDEPSPNLADMSADEALRWLEDQAALAEAKSVPVQGLAQTEGLDDAGLEAEAGVPDIESMNADEAMAWLEKLAAQQGASADELLTAPEDRPDDTPDWIVAAQQAEAETAPEPPALAPGLVPDWLAELKAAGDSEPEPPLEPAILPDWLKPPSGAGAPTIDETPAVAQVTEPAAPEPVMASGPDFASMDAEAAMAWLEGLAAQQGANPEELLSAPEERPTEAPAWVQAEETAAAPEPVMAVPADEPVEITPVMEAAPPDAPALAEAPVAEQEAAEPEPVEAPKAATTTAPLGADIDRLARLSERLAAGRRAKEAEIEARFAQQRAEQEEARRLVWESMQAKKAAVESAIEAIEGLPASAEEPAAPTPPAEPPVRGRTGPLTPPPPRAGTDPLRAMPDESAWVPATPPHRAASVSRYAGQAPETVLAEAQASLRQQDAAAAAAALEHLVSSGAMVDSVIGELEGTAAGGTASVPLLRVLGDAYARSNRLEQALATYRQALRKL